MIFHALRARQVHVFFRARLTEPRFGAGPESLEVKLVEEKDIPWDEIAFPSSTFALRRYFADRAAGREDLHITDSTRSAGALGPGERVWQNNSRPSAPDRSRA